MCHMSYLMGDAESRGKEAIFFLCFQVRAGHEALV